MLLTGALHFAQDAITSPITARLFFFDPAYGIWASGGRSLVSPWILRLERRHWFFVAIGADQLLHAYALAWAWALCVGGWIR